ncbi:restriction endonuclease [uncultured Ilyobacter sp.]|uniref:restriction endonuclease n=1 Tax=uncultured Ilyobacter sp. TaxID=544433 RepID=UPI002AA93ACB|nr:restriction endonuclease [uncultured Ilyobacter sp.]
MAIPNYQEIMLPLLKLVSDKNEWSIQNSVEKLEINFNLTAEEKKETTNTGTYLFKSRVGWSKSYLIQAQFVESTRRGFFRVTERGLAFLKTKPQDLNNSILMEYTEFKDFINRNKKNQKTVPTNNTEKTPQEILEDAYMNIKETLSQELLTTIKNSTPSFFEQLVVDLLIAMGYGGSRKEAGETVGQTNDGGIDGIIKEDKLGLDIIYIQAKRWDTTVSRPEIQKFAGALQGQRAKKGIFITTSDFSSHAYDYVKNIDSKIVLINGEILTNLMIDNNVGISSKKTYTIKGIDLDYFAE